MSDYQLVSTEMNSVEGTDGMCFCNVSITAPTKTEHIGANIICLLDKSGSMDTVASDPDGKEKSAFTRLDLAKHSIAVLANQLGPMDSICLVNFNDEATVAFESPSVTESARASLLSSLNATTAGGCTGMWSALKLALDRAMASHSPHTSILLLTDGEPTDDPSGGIPKAFRERCSNLSHPKAISLHTLGYGYGVQSQLLFDLAETGSGLYAFIPDASMVGTVFVNFISSLLATAHHHVRVTVDGPTGFRLGHLAESKAVDKKDPHQADKHSNDVLDIGPILFGQTRDVCLVAPHGWVGTVSFASVGMEADVPLGAMKLEPLGSQATSVPAVAVEQYARFITIKHVLNSLASADMKARQDELAVLGRELRLLVASFGDSHYLKDLLLDTTGEGNNVGQIGHAVERDAWFTKWGKHYLPSIARAHCLQMCMNFKDAALQHYGGPLFRSIQSEVEGVFCSLPAPIPSGSIKPAAHAHASSATGQPHAIPASPSSGNMSAFYNQGGGCFFGSNSVCLHDGRVVAIRDLRRGDQVPDGCGAFHPIACVTMTPVPANGTAEFYDIGDGVLLTPYHPVWQGTRWAFPIDVGTHCAVPTEALYNFLLDGGASMAVAGHRCITLAHGISDNTVTAHAYLGTACVSNDLRGMRGWATGRVVLDGAATERHPVTQRITRWVEA